MRQRRTLQLEVLEHLAQLSEPIGSGALLETIVSSGRRISRPTIGRILEESDRLGITSKVSNKGRLLTDEGRRFLEEARRQAASSQLSNEQLAKVGQASLTELRHALVARRSLEREAARLAAEHAQPDHTARMRRILDLQRQSAATSESAARAAVDFHVALADASGNQFLASALHLIRSSTQNIRSLMGALGVRIGGDSYPHHLQLLEAISARDSREAERLAGHHINEFIRYVDCWLSGVKPAGAEPRGAVGGSSSEDDYRAASPC